MFPWKQCNVAIWQHWEESNTKQYFWDDYIWTLLDDYLYFQDSYIYVVPFILFRVRLCFRKLFPDAAA